MLRSKLPCNMMHKNNKNPFFVVGFCVILLMDWGFHKTETYCNDMHKCLFHKFLCSFILHLNDRTIEKIGEYLCWNWNTFESFKKHPSLNQAICSTNKQMNQMWIWSCCSNKLKYKEESASSHSSST